MIGYFFEWVKRSDLKTLAILNDRHDMTIKHRRLFLILRKNFQWQQKKHQKIQSNYPTERSGSFRMGAMSSRKRNTRNDTSESGPFFGFFAAAF